LLRENLLREVQGKELGAHGNAADIDQRDGTGGRSSDRVAASLANGGRMAGAQDEHRAGRQTTAREPDWSRVY